MSNSKLIYEYTNPWKTLASEQVYRNPWITVYHEKVLNPSGNEGIYGVVHFHHRAVGILPVDRDGFTYLVGQYRYPTDEYSYEIPEGGCPPEESPLDSARRELLEETGLGAEKWECLLEMTLSNCVSDERGIVYLAQGVTRVQDPQPDDTEELKILRLPIREAIEWAMEGKIKDSLSVAALLKYHINLIRGNTL